MGTVLIMFQYRKLFVPLVEHFKGLPSPCWVNQDTDDLQMLFHSRNRKLVGLKQKRPTNEKQYDCARYIYNIIWGLSLGIRIEKLYCLRICNNSSQNIFEFANVWEVSIMLKVLFRRGKTNIIWCYFKDCVNPLIGPQMQDVICLPIDIWQVIYKLLA